MMSHVSFISDDSYLGEGASIGIPRGLMVRQREIDLTQEGLGLGAVALRRNGLTYFPTSSRTSAEGMLISKEFTVDSALVLESPVLPLSKIMPLYGLGTRTYMMLPGCQERMLGLRSRVFSWFKVRSELRRTTPLATAIVTYAPQADSVIIKASVRSHGGALPDVFIMNELGADHFSSAIRDGIVGPAPTGWCPLPDNMPSPALMDEEHGTMFFIDHLKHGKGIGVHLFWGREKSGDLCWAGFELELRNIKELEVMNVQYEVRFGGLSE